MEENMSDNDTDSKDDCDNTQPNRNSKRIKIQFNLNSGEGTSNSTEQDNTASASTSNGDSSPSHRTRTKSYRNRNYRNTNREDSSASANESGEDEAVSEEENNTESNLSFVEYSSSPESTSTVIRETDTDSEAEEPPVLKKTKPKHTWYVVPEVIKRQLGYSSKLHSAELFRNQCYGSLHSVQRLELMYKLEEHFGCVNSLNFYPDGSLLASGSDDLFVVVWDWKVGKCLLKYKTKHLSNVFQSKFLHLCGDLHIATCSRDGQVRVARLSREGGVRENRKIGSHKSACHKLAVLPDQPHIILSAGEDGYVLSHDVRKTKSDHITTVKRDNKPVPLYSIHGHPLRTHEFCVGGQDIKVRVYDQRKSSTPLHIYNPFKSEPSPYLSGLHITSAMYNYNGDEILASYNDGDIYLFNSESIPGEYVHKYEGHKNGATIKGVNFFGPKSEFIVSGSDCGNIFFWEKNTEAIVQCMLGDDSGVVNCLEPHPKLPYICTSGLDWDVKVWVPSCETEPSLEKLPEIVKTNKKNRFSSLGLASDAPVLWMLWQHLRRSSRTLRRELRGMNFGPDDLGLSSGSDNDEDMNDTNDEDMNDTNEEEDDDEDEDDERSFDFTSECTTS
ncbi:DDB1- and CUL4-associated factor 8 [Coccinella septempunctata]|uniref:DDB1- and CUL4-associated factor 8 n=1 Tax=Coccinella septempunctata TaxID=41139 RepID=UPI001D0651A3|nr:DDB1- and CUL4-associated factor 8 [Coccinella septempunctata]XP_044748125.1 DDB1- and CUL4-associated factor 8 [Coccinella septempunctata]XP_044748126.1 DDB1- and CUL4-associated factor 8 [Coccinella septempunctata]XP_044748127.1 DDB1- and CUL4-associated factor 8 [Coccinella septempunctata]